MAGNSQKKLVKDNQFFFKLWLGITLAVDAFAAFMIFYIYKDSPEKQNIKTFEAGVVGEIICIVYAWRYTRVKYDPEKKQVSAKGDLRKSPILDALGVSMIVVFIGIWWCKASWIFILFPIMFLFTLLQKLLGFLKF